MAFNFLKKKWQKVVLTVLLVITGIILLLAVLINRYWSPILADKVKSAVLDSSDSLYKVSFIKAELHVLQGKIVLYDITLKPDTNVYNRRMKQHLAPNNLVLVHVKRLVVSHIHPFTLYFKHKLEIGQIILSAPEIHVSYRLNHTKDTLVKDTRTTWQKISKSLRSIHVGDILLNDVKFKYQDYSGNKMAVSELKEMNLRATDLLIDSATQADTSRLLYCKDIVTELNNFHGKTPNGLYTYKINFLKLSTHTSQLNIEGLSLEPVKAGTFFNKSKTSRFTINIDSLQLNNFDFLSYHKYRTVNASSLIFSKGTLAMFANPNAPPKHNDKIKTFPNVALSQVQADIKIDTILVRRSNVIYSEFNKKSKKTGTITFNQISARFLNVTTNKIALQKNNICTADVTSYFMNRGRFKVAFAFNLTDKNAAFNCKGTLGQIALQYVNPAIMPLAMVKITSGTVKQFDFDIHADRKVSKGKITLLYNDLKVQVLKADSINDRLKRRPIASLFANIFIIKHDNPDHPGEPARSFNVSYIRPVDSPFFKTLWKTLLQGIKLSAGLDAKTQQATAAKISKHEINKKNRQEKKALRKQKRAERKHQRELKKQQKEAAKAQ